MCIRFFYNLLGIITLCVVLTTGISACKNACLTTHTGSTHIITGEELQDEVIRFTRAKTLSAMNSNEEVPIPESLEIKGHWNVETYLYENGDVIGVGSASKPGLGNAIAAATSSITKNYALDKEAIDHGRFLVTVIGKNGENTSIIEFKGKGLVLVGDVVAVPEITKDIVLKKIAAGKEYLLKNMNQETHAFHKLYDIENNDYSTRVHTIYTASSLYTLLKLSDRNNDPCIQEKIPFTKDYLLSMQSDENLTRGAFHYSYDIMTKKKDGKFKVGTTSKTIYTLLELYRRTNDTMYLTAAQKAGDWLLSMQRPDGWMRSQVHMKRGELVYDERRSFLYSGQVLSALSRLYAVTKDERYLAGAEKIASLFMSESVEQNFAVSDDYRFRCIISASWVAMSLLDYYKVSRDENAWDIITTTLSCLIAKQHNYPKDLLNYGRFEGSFATSGNGWINEVLSEVYLFCRQEGKDLEHLEQYKTASKKVTRWLVQNTYSEENTFFLKNPEKAFGGLIRNREEETVRTDAVCHALNGYVNMLDAYKS